MRPWFSSESLPPCTLLLLMKEDGPSSAQEQESYRLILPLNDSYLRSTPGNEVMIYSDGASSDSRGGGGGGGECSFFESRGTDPVAMLADAVEQIAPPPPPLAGEPKKRRAALPGLGWASWNSFYTDLTSGKVKDGVKQLVSALANERSSGGKGHGVALDWVLIDDGWQDTDVVGSGDGSQWGGKLKSLKPSPLKFPASSMKGVIEFLKASLGVKKVFAWHALGGYWTGLSSDLAADYPSLLPASAPVFPPSLVENDGSLPDELSISNMYSVPKTYSDAFSFYKAYHANMKSLGFDGVKVDAQVQLRGAASPLFSCAFFFLSFRLPLTPPHTHTNQHH